VTVDKRKLRKVELHHMSWAEVVTAAVQTRVHRGVEDPDQAWILGELIRYLEHPRSGALDFDDMGQAWVGVRDATVAGTVRANDKGVLEVASRWDQLLRFAAIRLGRELGADVQVVIARKETADPSARLGRFVAELVEGGTSRRATPALAPNGSDPSESRRRAANGFTTCTTGAADLMCGDPSGGAAGGREIRSR
jgi:hypothetical protein